MNLLGPAIAFMQRIRFRGKFMAVGTVVFLALGWNTTTMVTTLNADLASARQERLGSDYLYALGGVAEAFARLRSGGDSSAKRALGAALDHMDAVHARIGPALSMGTTWSDSVGQWRKVAVQADGASLDALTADLLGAISKVGDNSGLILDPQLDSFYVMDLALLKQLQQGDSIAQAMALADGILLRKSLTAEESTTLTIFLGTRGPISRAWWTM